MKELRLIIPKAWANIREYFLPLCVIAFFTESIILLGNFLLLPLIDSITIESSFINIDYIKGVLNLLLPIALFPLTLSATTYLITTEDNKFSTGIIALKFLKPKLPILLSWGCIWFLAIFMGMEFLAFPGLFVLISMIFVGPTISSENTNIITAVKRSFALIKKKTINICVILFVFIFVQAALAYQGAYFISDAIPALNAPILRWIFSIILLPLVYVPIAEVFLHRQSEQTLLTKKKKLKVKKKKALANA